MIIRSQSGFFFVKSGESIYTCQLRGRLKQGRRQGDIASIGDWVVCSILGDNTGMIEEIEEREHMFSRLAPMARGEYQQILIANPDQAIIVFSCKKPEPRLRMLDRFLIVAEKADIPVLIIFNKVDLIGVDQAEKLYSHYRDIGYSVIFTSAITNYGLDDLKAHLQDKISLLAGPSGVGKSSLLNVMQPGLGLKVRDVSKATKKGRHTTVARELFELDFGGYLADTPGLKTLGLWDIEPEEVDGYFPELRDLVMDCQFSDCTHIHEPGCAVISAVEEGLVHPDRYQSYVRLRMGDDD